MEIKPKNKGGRPKGTIKTDAELREFDRIRQQKRRDDLKAEKERSAKLSQRAELAKRDAENMALRNMGAPSYESKFELKEHKEHSDTPHLPGHGYKFYKWSREFFESQNKMNLLVAANQATKSSTMIRKCIHWCTAKELWPRLWRTRPRSFFYIYPDSNILNIEYQSKWVPLFLPRNDAKVYGPYAWKPIIHRGEHVGIEFIEAEIFLWFKTYSQKLSAFQAVSLHGAFTDEELPPRYYPELAARLNATDGYYHQVFTATSGHEMWRQAMNPGRGDKEIFPDAYKREISLYDCIEYEDGTPGQYTVKRIEEIKRQCGTELEVQRRVYGKFVSEVGLRFPTFQPDIHFIKPFQIPANFYIYAGVDLGSGLNNHPAAIIFLAVNPEMTKGYIFKGWRGNDVETTASDVMDKFLQMKGALRPVCQVYDYSSKEFGIIAGRIGESFTRAEKSRDLGTQTVNALFKNLMLFIFDIEELQPLGGELLNSRLGEFKTVARDDFIDAKVYTVTKVPWDWSCIVSDDVAKLKEEIKIELVPLTPKELLAEEITKRRAAFDEKPQGDWGELGDEIQFWNSVSGNS